MLNRQLLTQWAVSRPEYQLGFAINGSLLRDTQDQCRILKQGDKKMVFPREIQPLRRAVRIKKVSNQHRLQFQRVNHWCSWLFNLSRNILMLFTYPPMINTHFEQPTKAGDTNCSTRVHWEFIANPKYTTFTNSSLSNLYISDQLKIMSAHKMSLFLILPFLIPFCLCYGKHIVFTERSWLELTVIPMTTHNESVSLYDYSHRFFSFFRLRGI